MSKTYEVKDFRVKAIRPAVGKSARHTLKLRAIYRGGGIENSGNSAHSGLTLQASIRERIYTG
jgi:hypothetical protein